MTDKEYYSDRTMLTNTMLGWLMISMKYFLQQFKKEWVDDDSRSYIHFGKGIHCKILEKKEFPKRFFVHRHKSPSNAVQKKYCQLLSVHKEINDKSLVSAYKLAYSVGKMTDEAILKVSNELYIKYKDYIGEEIKVGNKQSVSISEYNNMLAIERNIMADKRARQLLFNNKDLDVYNEKVIKFKILDIDMKSKIDRFTIDFKNKTIQLIDVKTHSTKREDVNLIKSFKNAIEIYNYDRQLYTYSVAIYAFLIQKYPDFDFSSWKFEQKIIMLRTNFGNDVRVFDIDKSFIENGEIKFLEALKRYKYYKENGYKNDYEANKLGEYVLKR